MHLDPQLRLLSPQVFYVLLALSRGESYAYEIGAIANNHSLGSVRMASGTLYPILTRLFEEGLIEQTGQKPAGPSHKPRIHYRLTSEGLYRLRNELKRLKHAVEVGETTDPAAGVTIPHDIQRILDQLKG